MDTWSAYHSRKAQLQASMRASSPGTIGLNKNTSNLFRDRKNNRVKDLDVRDFNHVLEVDVDGGMVEAEGMTPFMALTDACLAHQLMPAVVPELQSITIGGAVTGVAIESSSFKYGLVHETVQELEILLSSGETVVARSDNEYSDLFFGFPNTYGTLGYALRVRSKVVPIKPYVHLQHHRFGDALSFFKYLEEVTQSDLDFLDGVIFSPTEMIVVVGKMIESAPYVSDYTSDKIFYQSIRQREENYLTIRDYIWRWDTDWFWCSKNLGAQNRIVRKLLGRQRLNSVTYTKLMRLNSRWGFTKALSKFKGEFTESVIQDVEIPIDNCQEFFEFYFDKIRFTPVWVCPLQAYRSDVQYDLYPMDSNQLYVNFGFWDVIRSKDPIPSGFHNKLIEAKVRELSGMKSLYSDAYFDEDTFWEIYNRDAYVHLKRKYDPEGRLKSLYEKCVLKA